MFTGRIGASYYVGGIFLLFGFLCVAYFFACVAQMLFGIPDVPFWSGTVVRLLADSGFSDATSNSFDLLRLALTPIPAILLLGIVASLGMQFRRLHDLNLPGWLSLVFWLFLSAVVAFGHTDSAEFLVVPAWAALATGLVLVLTVSFWSGHPEENTYGLSANYASWWAALIGSKHEILRDKLITTLPSTGLPSALFPEHYTVPPQSSLLSAMK